MGKNGKERCITSNINNVISSVSDEQTTDHEQDKSNISSNSLGTKTKVAIGATIGLIASIAIASLIMYQFFPNKLQDIGMNKAIALCLGVILIAVTFLITVITATLNSTPSKSQSSNEKREDPSHTMTADVSNINNYTPTTSF